MRRLAIRATRLPGLPALLELGDRVAPAPPNQIAVLTYHRVDTPGARPGLSDRLISATPSAFAEQMEIVARAHHVISMRELLEVRDGNAPLPPKSVLITFDDAYRDFADHAWPVLRRLGLPVTVFVPTAYPGSDRRFWWDRLDAAIMTSSRSGVVETDLGQLVLDGSHERRSAVSRAIVTLKALPHDEVLALVDRVVADLGNPSPVGDPSPVLTWDELRALEAEGVALAPHSRTHPRLDQLPPERLDDEIAGSRDDLAAEASDPLPVFAYPDGGHSDAVVAAVADAGFAVAFTTTRGGNRLGEVDWLRLRRINVGQATNAAILRGQLLLMTRFGSSEGKVGAAR